MNIGLYQSAASLSALERWQDAVAQNITSSQVSGFKKRTVEFSTISMGEIRSDPHAKGGGDGTKGAMFPKATLGVNFQAGETLPTRREFDIALEGDGFFEVQMPDGTRGYTRAGELHPRADRTIVSRDNLPLLTDGGTPITMLPQGGGISITQEGVVTQGDAQLGKISVVRFADNSQLIPLGGGVFVPSAGAAPLQVEAPQVLQGYLENSNVTPLREMIALVQIARAYEANQKIISSRDQTLQRTLETLG